MLFLGAPTREIEFPKSLQLRTGGDPDQLFSLMCEAHSKLPAYKQACHELLVMCRPHLSNNGNQSRGAMSGHLWLKMLSREELDAISEWSAHFLECLERWSSWTTVTLLIERDRVKAELINVHETFIWKSADSSADILRLHSLETREALEATLSSDRDLMRMMDLQGLYARSLLDLLDETIDGITPEDPLYGQCFRVLRELSACSSDLPTSCIVLGSDLRKKTSKPSAVGEFTRLWQGTYRGRSVALKEICKYLDLDKARKSFGYEVPLWKRLVHPNIVLFLGMSTTVSSFCMVSEWMENGNVHSYLQRNKQVDRFELLVDVANGLQYLHNVGVVHGNLRGDNILVDDTDHARLADFGLTGVYLDAGILNTIPTSSKGNGSVRWKAPELMTPEQPYLFPTRPSKKGDIYSLGIVIWEILSGKVPFAEFEDDVTVMAHVMQGARPPRPLSATVLGLSDLVWSMVEACWNVNELKRPDIASILESLKAPERLAPLNQLFLLICEAYDSLRAYKKTCRELLVLCEPFVTHPVPGRNAGTSTDRKIAFVGMDKLKRTDFFQWFETLLERLRYWSSQDALTHLISRARMKADLEEICGTFPWHFGSTSNDPETQRTKVHNSILQQYAAETMESLEAVLSSKDDMKRIMRFQESAVQPFLDLLDKTMDEVNPENRLYGQCFHLLRRLSARSAILPSSCVLADSNLAKKSEQPLASGGFADVWQGAYQGRSVALKVIRLYDTSDLTKVKKSFCREVLLWKRLVHPNISHLLGISTTLFPFCMVSDWMENGNISSYLQRNRNANRLQLLVDVASGLRYLHRVEVVHGDLKGGNILIDSTHRARLSDFGLTGIYHDATLFSTITTSSNGDGSIRWMAPELFDPAQAGLSSGRPSKQSDIYALGMVIFEIFAGKVPFHEHPIDATVIFMVAKGIRPERPNSSFPLGLCDKVWRLAEFCWESNRDKRPEIPAVLHGLEEALCAFIPPTEHEAERRSGPTPMDDSESDLSSEDESQSYEHVDFRV